MNTNHPTLRLIPFALALCLALAGCNILKPARTNARRFVLTPVAAAATDQGAGSTIAVGVGQVRIPEFLNGSSLAVRRDTNEVDYLPLVLWGERVDTGLQRVVAANLASLLPTDRIRLSAWRLDEVSVELYITFQQFDVDTKGHAVLSAWWRILSPGGDKTLKLGDSHFSRQGPSPETDPGGAVATLSELAGELSSQLAAAIKANAANTHP